MQLELPHINVLSKIDLLSTYGELPFDLRYYTEVQDMSYLLDSLDKQDRMGKFRGLNKAMVELVEEYGLVGFETLAVEVSHIFASTLNYDTDSLGQDINDETPSTARQSHWIHLRPILIDQRTKFLRALLDRSIPRVFGRYRRCSRTVD
jgi:hypothetical protein